MSIHAAKGLEFPVVCVADLGRAAEHAPPDLLVDGERVGLRLRAPRRREAAPALDYEELARGAPARRGRGGGPDPLRRDDARARAAAAERRGRLRHAGPSSARARPPIAWLAPALSAELPELAAAAQPAGARPGASAERAGALRLSSPAERRRGRSSRGCDVRRRAAPVPRAAARTARGSARRGGRGGGERRAGAAPARRAGGAGSDAGASRRSATPRSPSSSAAATATTSNACSAARGRAAARARSARGRRSRRGRAARSCTGCWRRSTSRARSAPSAERGGARAARELGMRTSAERARGDRRACSPRRSRRAPAARLARPARVRREHPFAFALGARGEPLVTGVIDLLAERARRQPAGASTTRATASAPRRTSRRWSSATTACSGCSTRSRCCATARASVEVVHWFLERPQEPVARPLHGRRARASSKRASRRASQRARAGGFAVSADPHRGLCLTCPGPGGPVLVGRAADAARGARGG